MQEMFQKRQEQGAHKIS